MYVEKFYSAKACHAFVVLGHCKEFKDVALEIALFEEVTKIDVPSQITTVTVEKGPYQNMTALKFPLHPVEVFEKKGGEWIVIEDTPGAADLLRPKKKVLV